MDDGVSVDVVDAGHDAFLELLFRTHADMRKTERANLEKKPSIRLSQEPWVGVKVNSKRPARWVCKPGLCFLGDVRGMIVEDQLDGRVRRVGGIENF